MVVLSGSEAFAVSPPAIAEPAIVVSPNPISAALCGRGEGTLAKLARALDEFGPSGVPPLIWREVKVEDLQGWLEAPPCAEPSESAANLFRSRLLVLDRLSLLLERAKVTEQIGPYLARFRGWRPNSAGWPTSSECDLCAALWSSAVRVADIASQWPPQTSAKVGARLSEAAKRELLVAALCAAKPSPDAREEIERRFRYYSWTSNGARLFEVAAFFKLPEVLAGCRSR